MFDADQFRKSRFDHVSPEMVQAGAFAPHCRFFGGQDAVMPGKSLSCRAQARATPSCKSDGLVSVRRTMRVADGRRAQAGMAAASSNAVEMSRMLITPIRL
jgi:hypothetical protein